MIGELKRNTENTLTTFKKFSRHHFNCFKGLSNFITGRPLGPMDLLLKKDQRLLRYYCITED